MTMKCTECGESLEVRATRHGKRYTTFGYCRGCGEIYYGFPAAKINTEIARQRGLRGMRGCEKIK